MARISGVDLPKDKRIDIAISYLAAHRAEAGRRARPKRRLMHYASRVKI